MTHPIPHPRAFSGAALQWLLAATLLLTATVQADAPDTVEWPAVRDLRGKVVLLDFWASWCAPCRKSLIWMNDLQKRYRAAGLEVVAVNLDKDRSLAEQFLAETPVSLRIEYDPDGALARTLRVETMPSSFLIDRSGSIRQRHRGFRLVQQSTREQQIVQLLKEPSP